MKSPSTEETRAEPARDPATSRALKLWVVLARAYQALARHSAADIGRHGLSSGEFAVLEALYHKGPMLLGEVQEKILVSSGGVTYLVDRLESKGLAERRECETDRRARYAALTPEGEALLASIFPAHAECIRRITSGLSEDEQDAVVHLLRTLGTRAAGMPPCGAEKAAQE